MNPDIPTNENFDIEDDVYSTDEDMPPLEEPNTISDTPVFSFPTANEPVRFYLRPVTHPGPLNIRDLRNTTSNISLQQDPPPPPGPTRSSFTTYFPLNTPSEYFDGRESAAASSESLEGINEGGAAPDNLEDIPPPPPIPPRGYSHMFYYPYTTGMSMGSAPSLASPYAALGRLMSVREAGSGSFQNIINQTLYEKESYKKVLSEEGKNQIKFRSFSVNDEIKQCPIMFVEFEEGEVVAELPCGHIFGKNAITKWLENEDASCPVCRKPLLSKEVKNEDEDEMPHEDTPPQPLSFESHINTLTRIIDSAEDRMMQLAIEASLQGNNQDRENTPIV